MASRKVKITLGIVGGVVGVVALAVIALVAWALFRPLLPGDYSSASGDLEVVSELNEFPLEAMVVSVGTPASAGEEGNLDNRIQNTIGQTEILIEYVAELRDNRAAQKDDELHAMVEQLVADYDILHSVLAQMQSDGYAAIGQAAKVCVNGENAECTSALSDAESAAKGEPELTALLDGVRSGDATGALKDFEQSVTELWSPIPEGVEAIDLYLAEHK